MLRPGPKPNEERLDPVVAAPVGLSRLARGRAFVPRVAGAMLFRYACYVLMLAMSLWAEARPAPHLPDLLIDHLPYLSLVDRYNHWLLTLAYIPLALALLAVDAGRFVRYNVTSGLLSLV